MLTNETFYITLKNTLENKFGNSIINDLEFRSVVLDMYHRMMSVSMIPDMNMEILEQMIKELQEYFQTDQTGGFMISEIDQGHIKWYKDRKITLENQYTDRFKEYLKKEKNWNKNVIRTVDSNTDDIMDYLGDPLLKTPWYRKGLILGDVQSGKTNTYTMIANKAIDSGYKVIIVLSGLTNSLRRQTQLRLEKEIVGFTRITREKSVSTPQRPIGVYYHGKVNQKVELFTSDDKDFSKRIAETISVSFSETNPPRIFVIKKVKAVLDSLFDWLPNTIDDHKKKKIDVPLLLIDDESDNASVNTKSDEDPTTINYGIRKILNIFNRKAYIGVTATPFANIFINPDISPEKNKLEDLFPDHFIYYTPSPTNYQGALKFFDSFDIDEENPLLIEIDETELEKGFCYGHKKDLVIDHLPPSLETAILYFILTMSIRDCRGHNKQHKSMLINVSRYTDVQLNLTEFIKDWLSDVVSAVENFSKLSLQKMLESNIMKRFYLIWHEFDLDMKVNENDFEYIINNYLFEAIIKLEIRAINQKSIEKLDYENHDEGLSVIAIGGNALSRGITLEGLTTTYFYRNSETYDTLMQMGRWFGYHPGYDDLVKIWISTEASAWYQHITEATEELKMEIIRMTRNGRSPRDFGLKVKGHPDSLIPTARNKMKNSVIKDEYLELDIAGRLIESPKLPIDRNKLDINDRVIRDFINQLDNMGTRDGVFVWRNLSYEDIEMVLSGFYTHDWSWYFDTQSLRDYIIKQKAKWDVAIVSTDSGKQEEIIVNNEIQHIKLEQRRIDKSNKTKSFRISGSKLKVGSGASSSLGLDSKTINELKRKYDVENKYENKNNKNYPDSIFLHIDRNPIMIIHFIEPKKDSDKDIIDYGKPVVAIGLGFINEEEYNKEYKPTRMRYYLNTIAAHIEEFDETGDDDLVDD